jgi:ribosomal protein L37AE/L43A
MANRHRLLINAAKCRKCGDTIVSRHRHDFVRCKCGAIAIDGGLDYARAVGNFNDFQFITEYEEGEEKDE